MRVSVHQQNAFNSFPFGTNRSDFSESTELLLPSHGVQFDINLCTIFPKWNSVAFHRVLVYRVETSFCSYYCIRIDFIFHYCCCMFSVFNRKRKLNYILFVVAICGLLYSVFFFTKFSNFHSSTQLFSNEKSIPFRHCGVRVSVCGRWMHKNDVIDVSRIQLNCFESKHWNRTIAYTAIIALNRTTNNQTAEKKLNDKIMIGRFFF